MQKTDYQTALFLAEIVALLKKLEAKKVIDATFGEGGHGVALAKLGMKVLGIEWDQHMYVYAKTKIKTMGLEPFITLEKDNFANVGKIASKNDFLEVDAVIFDLGLSMRQLKEGARGFSFKQDDFLDLRISSKLKLTAADIINSLEKQKLYDLFTKYIEDVNSGRLVDLIVQGRKNRQITKTGHLLQLMKKLNLKPESETLLMRKTLQGLRLIVNQELENLRKGFAGSVSVLRKGGLVFILTFHSLEDRIVKLFFKNREDFKSYFHKPLQNKQLAFAKSAKLRVYQKK